MKKTNRAWFLDGDGRFPITLHIIYSNKPLHIFFMKGEKHEYNINENLHFKVKNVLKAKLDYIKTWDFLPNSSGVPLANERALKLLEEVCAGEFQAIPTEIIMPDGYIIKEYKLINALNRVNSVDYSKSKLKPERYQKDWNKYDVYAHKLDCLEKSKLNLGVSNELVFLGSEKLKQAIKKANLKGLVFKDKRGGNVFLEE